MARRCLLWFLCCPAVVAGAGWEEPDETSLLQLTRAHRQLNQSHAAQRQEEQREGVRSRALARNVTEQKQIASDINLVKMDKLVSDMEMRRDNDAPDADSADSNADVDDASGDPGNWDDNEKAVLDTLKSALQNQFTPFLDAEHSADTGEYNAGMAVHRLCIKHNVEDNDAVTEAHGLLETNRDKHRACRKSQKSWNAYKSVAIGGSSCAGASDIQNMHEVYDKHEQLAELMQAAKTDAQTYVSLAPAGVKRDCAQDQQTYESHWCAWRASKDDSCEQLQRCTVAVNLNDLKTKLETRAANRGRLYDTVAKLLCRIDHLLLTFAGSDEDVSDFSTEDTCDDVPDTIRYAMSLEVPHHTSCSPAGEAAGDAVAPSESTCSDWIAQEYSVGNTDWSSTTHVLPTTCQESCPTRTPTAPPALHDGCADDPAGCEFYNAHPAACGNYDTDSDLQSTDCCACAEPTSGATPSPGASPGDLVVFDEYNPAYTVSPGSLTGYIPGQYWNHFAKSDHQVMASDSICGISFKCGYPTDSHGSDQIMGIASGAITGPRHAYYAMDFSIRCISGMDDSTVLNPDAVGVLYYGNRGNLINQDSWRTFPYSSQDVHAILVNPEGAVEFSVNGEVRLTSSSTSSPTWSSRTNQPLELVAPVTYPWHVAVDVALDFSFSDVKYLEC